MNKLATIECERGMSNARYRMALVRMRRCIEMGIKPFSMDNGTVGDKYTNTSWGMCSKVPEMWPQAGDHRFPVDFIKYGRISPHRRDFQTCPLQTDANEPEATIWGCFYKCLLFQAKKQQRKMEQGFILYLYNQRIKVIGEYPEVCGCDGTRQLIDPVGRDKMIECPDCVSVMYPEQPANLKEHSDG